MSDDTTEILLGLVATGLILWLVGALFLARWLDRGFGTYRLTAERVRAFTFSNWIVELVYWPVTYAAALIIIASVPFVFQGGFLVGPFTAWAWSELKEIRDGWHEDPSPTVGGHIDELLLRQPTQVYGPHSFNGFGGTPSRGGRVPVSVQTAPARDDAERR